MRDYYLENTLRLRIMNYFLSNSHLVLDPYTVSDKIADFFSDYLEPEELEEYDLEPYAMEIIEDIEEQREY